MYPHGTELICIVVPSGLTRKTSNEKIKRRRNIEDTSNIKYHEKRVYSNQNL